MIPRIGLDLEPGVQIARLIPDLDLLDVAYGAVRGGAQIILLPVSVFVTSTTYTPDLFNRPGLPLFAVKTEEDDLDRVPGLGVAPDRVVVTGARGTTISDVSRVADVSQRVVGTNQEIGVLVAPDPVAIKELSRARVQWAYFSTENVYHAASREEAEAETARIASAALAANRLNLRVALYGPTGRHLPPSLGAMAHIEEIYPAPDLWAMALRLGWEGAISEYRFLLR
ncbi:MAG TPA: pyridoxine 5'-phosphate synthase [bacterium]